MRNTCGNKLTSALRHTLPAGKTMRAAGGYGRYAVHLLFCICLGCAGNKDNLGEKLSDGQTVAADTAGSLPPHGHFLSTWSDESPEFGRHGQLPPAAEDCSMLYDPKHRQVLLFGGKNDADENLNELWALDLQSHAWHRIDEQGELPPASEDHVTMYDPVGHRMLLHGGENGPTWNHLWSLDLETYTWRNLTSPESPALENHTAVFDSRRKAMLIYGGEQNSEPQQGLLWRFGLDPQGADFERWAKIEVWDPLPPGRSDHVAVYDSSHDRLVIYGGFDKDDKEFLGDTWAYSISQNRWRMVKTKYSHPPARRHMTGVYAAERNWLIIYGGFGDRGFLNDVWAFDLENYAWLNITPGPQPRVDHQAIYDPISGRMFIYGGDGHFPQKFHDLWSLQVRPDFPTEQMIRVATHKH